MMDYFTQKEYDRRVAAVQENLDSDSAVLVTEEPNVEYLSGCGSGSVLVTASGIVQWMEVVYFDLVRNKNIETREKEKNAIRDFINKKNIQKVYSDTDSLSLLDYFKKKLDTKITPSKILSDIRLIKSHEEIAFIEKSSEIAIRGMEKAYEVARAGITEFEAVAQIEAEIRRNGSTGAPFDSGILFLSGPHAQFPHHPPTFREIKDGDFIVVDLGAVYNGYYSDMTRTIEIGSVEPERQRISEFVDNLRSEAIDRIEVGGKISEIYDFMKQKIEDFGYKFHHLGGHGVGLRIHENPSIGPYEEGVFKEGMVFAIEPGIYTKGFGTRWEDTIVLEKSPRILTR